jgi:hypothetical protein
MQVAAQVPPKHCPVQHSFDVRHALPTQRHSSASGMQRPGTSAHTAPPQQSLDVPQLDPKGAQLA